MKSKAIKAFLALISALLISEAFFIAIHFAVVGEYQRVNDNLVSEYRLTKVTSGLVDSFYDLIQYSNDSRRIAAFRTNLSELKALLDKLDVRLAGTDSWAVYSGVKNTVNMVIGDVNKGLEDISAGNFSDVTNDYLKAAKDNIFVRENTSALLVRELEGVERSQAKLLQTKFWSETIGLALLAAAFLGSLLYAFYFSKKSAEPIQRITQYAKSLASGNYEDKIDAGLKSGNDEASSLAGSLETMAASLKENAKKMKDKDDQLAHIHGVLAEDGMPRDNKETKI